MTSRYKFDSSELAMIRSKKYALVGKTLMALGYRPGRSYKLVQFLLVQIGQHCVDNCTDGVFSMDDVLRLPSRVQRRTITQVHFPELLACGAVKENGDGQYVIPHFHCGNASAEHQRLVFEDWRDQKKRAFIRSKDRLLRHPSPQLVLDAPVGGAP